MAKIQTSLMPYSDGSGCEFNITVQGNPNKQEAEITCAMHDFGNDSEIRIAIEDWPQVRDGIERAVQAFKDLDE